jgi:hypothetical protein
MELEKNSLEENINLFRQNHFETKEAQSVVKLVMQIHGDSDAEEYE